MPARLAQHLVARGLLSAQMIEAAQRHRAAHGGTLDTALLELGDIAEPGMLQAMADVSTLRPVNLADFEPNPEMSRFIPANVAQRLGAIPLSEHAGVLHVACSYPPPTRDLEDVSLLLGRKLELWVAIEARVQEWIASIYGTPLPTRYGVLLAALDPHRARPAPIPLSQPVTPPATAPAETVSEPIPDEIEISLEDSLTEDMVEQIARAVAEEPILLEVRKKPKDPPPTWERQETVRIAPEQARQLRESVAATGREETVQIDAERANALRAAAAAPTRSTPRPPSDRAPTQPEFPAVVVFPDPRSPTPAAPAKGDIAASADAPAWTLEQARAALRAATRDRDALIGVAVRFARQTFGFAAAFAVVRGQAVLHDAAGENADTLRGTGLSVPLDASSVFRTVTMTRGSYVGPPPPDELTAAYLQQMSRAPRTVFLFPIEVKNRVVCLVYGDSGSKPVSQRRLSELLLLCQELPLAFGELLVFRKQRFGTFEIAEAEASPTPSLGIGWSPAAPTSVSGSTGRTISLPSFRMEDPVRPPSDFGPLLQKLIGPDAAARASAMAELARTPEPSARELAKHFPGPTAWSRLPVTELPEAEELGPIPTALSRLGRHGAQALAPLLDSDDADLRYYALLTAGSLKYPELVGGVLRGLFDYEPDIASAARAAATTLRRLPRFDTAMRDLRQELAAVDPLRRSLAARVLGVLHDRESIEALINLTGSDDALCAQAAAEALNEITRASIGPDQRRWSAWWAENRSRSRAEWLIAALRHADVDVRLSAIEELSRALNDNLGYYADAPHAERDAAVGRWLSALAQTPKLKRLD